MSNIDSSEGSKDEQSSTKETSEAFLEKRTHPIPVVESPGSSSSSKASVQSSKIQSDVPTQEQIDGAELMKRIENDLRVPNRYVLVKHDDFAYIVPREMFGIRFTSEKLATSETSEALASPSEQTGLKTALPQETSEAVSESRAQSIPGTGPIEERPDTVSKQEQIETGQQLPGSSQVPSLEAPSAQTGRSGALQQETSEDVSGRRTQTIPEMGPIEELPEAVLKQKIQPEMFLSSLTQELQRYSHQQIDGAELIRRLQNDLRGLSHYVLLKRDGGAMIMPRKMFGIPLVPEEPPSSQVPPLEAPSGQTGLKTALPQETSETVSGRRMQSIPGTGPIEEHPDAVSKQEQIETGQQIDGAELIRRFENYLQGSDHYRLYKQGNTAFIAPQNIFGIPIVSQPLPSSSQVPSLEAPSAQTGLSGALQQETSEDVSGRRTQTIPEMGPIEEFPEADLKQKIQPEMFLSSSTQELQRYSHQQIYGAELIRRLQNDLRGLSHYVLLKRDGGAMIMPRKMFGIPLVPEEPPSSQVPPLEAPSGQTGLKTALPQIDGTELVKRLEKGLPPRYVVRRRGGVACIYPGDMFDIPIDTGTSEVDDTSQVRALETASQTGQAAAAVQETPEAFLKKQTLTTPKSSGMPISKSLTKTIPRMGPIEELPKLFPPQ